VSPDTIARLQADLAALKRPDGSEEGVAVLLVGENLAATERKLHEGSSEGTKLAQDFRRIAEAYIQLQPAAPEADIPKLVEVLAHRDFGHK